MIPLIYMFRNSSMSKCCKHAIRFRKFSMKIKCLLGFECSSKHDIHCIDKIPHNSFTVIKLKILVNILAECIEIAIQKLFYVVIRYIFEENQNIYQFNDFGNGCRN